MDDSKGTLKSLLEKMRDQNKTDLLLQTLQVKYEKEVAGEDNDKREQQLDKVIENLEKIEKAVIGNKEQLKVVPKDISDVINVKLSKLNVPEEEKTFNESLKELVGSYKTFEQKLAGTFDKGFEFLSNPLKSMQEGLKNLAAKGQERKEKAIDYFKDVANTPAGATAESIRFTREFQKQNRKFSTGMSREEIAAGGYQVQGQKVFEEKIAAEKSIAAAEADIAQSAKYGFGATSEDRLKLVQAKNEEQTALSNFKIKTGEEKLKDVEAKQSKNENVFASKENIGEEKLKEVEAKQSKNEEADNVVSAQESIADSFKENNELIKELLTTTKEQLNSVNNIKDALAPKEVSDEESSLRRKTEKFYDNVTVKLEEIYSKLDDLGTGKLSDTLLDLLSKRAPTSIPKTATTASTASAGSPLLAGATLGAVALGGAAATVGATGILATESAAPLRKAVAQNPMLGAMSGDTALASGILDANEGKSAEQIRAIQEKEQKALQDAPWYTKMLGIGRSEYLRKQGAQPATPVESISGTITKKELTQRETKSSSNLDITKDPKFQKLLQEEKEVILGGKVRRGEENTERLSAKELITAEKEAKARYLQSNVSPAVAKSTGIDMAKATTENTELNREVTGIKSSPAPVIMNNSSSNNNTSYVPMKSTPRPEYTGSALDRYQSRISTY